MKLFFESATQKLARKRSERIDEELRRNCSTTPPPINNVHNSLTSPAITSTHNNSSQITIENSNYCTRTTSSSSSGTPSGAGGPKILLLGAGDSGKTTVLKQLKILHGNGFSDLERMQYRGWIMDNIVDSMRALLHAMDRLGIPYGEQGNEFYGRQVKENFARISVPSSTSSSTIIGGGKISATGSTSMSGVGSDIPSHIHTAIKTLWADAGVRMCMRRSNEFFIQDTAEYFLNQLDRFFHISFIPTDQGEKTESASEKIEIFDVGGQRSDRLFWAPYFEGNIHAILFVISLAAYDQMLEEDVRCNRMEDAVQLFSSICSNSLLRDCNIILFLNKTDLFERKLKDSPVQKYFADYVPDSSCSTSELRTACRYFKRLFISQNVSHHPHGNSNYNNHEPQRRIYPHFTTGTDTAHMRVIISAVRDIVVRCALQASGIY